MKQYEYVVWDNIDNKIHRGPWSERECYEWIEWCRENFPDTAQIDRLWSVRRRSVGEWLPYDDPYTYGPNDWCSANHYHNVGCYK